MTDSENDADRNKGNAAGSGDTANNVVWCNADLPEPARERLREGVAAAGCQLHLVSASAEGLNEADVAFGQPDPNAVLTSARLRWVHLTSAGYTRYDRDDLRDALQARGATLTNSSHVYDEPCAQHALAMMLAFARQLPQCLEEQRGDRAWRTAPRRKASFLLNGQTTLFLGYGAIGRRLAQLLAPFRMRLIAVRRSPTGAEAEQGVEAVTEAELDRMLPQADHVVNLLPESPSTQGYMTPARFDRMKPGALFYNIGRGATVDQKALLAALESGQVGAAYLDVTSPEPLPADHPLWSEPNCFITPHSAGGHAGETLRLVEHFLSNLNAFREGRPLHDRVF
jgi:phosphoglycerate dehydrogenase-like enzyme